MTFDKKLVLRCPEVTGIAYKFSVSLMIRLDSTEFDHSGSIERSNFDSIRAIILVFEFRTYYTFPRSPQKQIRNSMFNNENMNFRNNSTNVDGNIMEDTKRSGCFQLCCSVGIVAVNSPINIGILREVHLFVYTSRHNVD